MAEASDFVRQKVPGPVCVPVNIFSGRIVAYATASDADTAKQEAKRVALDARRPLVQDDEGKTCPQNCPQPGSSSAPNLHDGELLCVQSDPNTFEYVAYHWAGWSSELDCHNNQQFQNQPAVTDFKLIQHVLPVPCPGRRILTGCVVAMAIEATQTDADRKAGALAQQKADERLGVHRQTACPAGCTQSVIGATAATLVKLEPHHDIPQARQGAVAAGAPRVVSYYAATWDVMVVCGQPAGGGEDEDDDGGDDGGHMYRGGGSQDNRR